MTTAGTVADNASQSPQARFCVHCGEGLAEVDHAGCHNPRTALEPPRFCAQCARRMVVQITPRGWTARCSRHGELTSS